MHVVLHRALYRLCGYFLKIMNTVLREMDHDLSYPRNKSGSVGGGGVN